jgi:hypothetical protein
MNTEEQNRKDAERYRWLRDYGHSHQVWGATASFAPGKGPYIRFEPPSVNSFSGIALWKGTADEMIDKAMEQSFAAHDEGEKNG